MKKNKDELNAWVQRPNFVDSIVTYKGKTIGHVYKEIDLLWVESFTYEQPKFTVFIDKVEEEN